MAMELLKTELVDGDPPVLQVIGEIDLSTVDHFRTALDEALRGDPRVVVDLAGVTFIDAVGAQAVLEAAARRNGAGPLRLQHASRLTWLLEIVGLGDLPSIVVLQEG
jgi:anti-anti-sigma factor